MDNEWAQKYIPKCSLVTKLYSSTSKVPVLHRNLSLMNLFSGTEWFVIQSTVHDKTVFHSLLTCKREQIFQIVVWLEKLFTTSGTRLNISSVTQFQHCPYSIPLRGRKSVPHGGNLDYTALTTRQTPDHRSTHIPHTQTTRDFSA